MAQFRSFRFVNDAELLAILNDPDTGTRKLQPGSPPDAVAKVQQALVDLSFAGVDEGFRVDGDWGPATGRACLRYKTHRNLRFPPGDPNGFIDEFAGPRTMSSLDDDSFLLDEASANIEAKIQALTDRGLSVVPGPITTIFANTPGALRASTIEGTVGAIFFRRLFGAFETHGAIHDAYISQHGSAEGPLGYPTSDEREDGDPDVRRSDFERGSLRFRFSTGKVELV